MQLTRCLLLAHAAKCYFGMGASSFSSCAALTCPPQANINRRFSLPPNFSFLPRTACVPDGELRQHLSKFGVPLTSFCGGWNEKEFLISKGCSLARVLFCNCRRRQFASSYDSRRCDLREMLALCHRYQRSYIHGDYLDITHTSLLNCKMNSLILILRRYSLKAFWLIRFDDGFPYSISTTTLWAGMGNLFNSGETSC